MIARARSLLTAFLLAVPALTACGLPATTWSTIEDIAVAATSPVASAPAPSTTLTVHNACLGSDYTVDVYMDGRYLGEVTYQRTFYGIPTGGTRSFRAVGTGAYGTEFRSSPYVLSALDWYLC